MLKSSIFISVMYLYINILGYILHIFIARILGPERYGEFMVVYSFMLSVGFLAYSYSNLTIKAVIGKEGIKYDLLRFMRIVSGITGLIFFFIVVVFSTFISDFLKIKQEYLIMVGVVWIFIFLAAVEKSFLQALNKFGVYSLLNSLELTIRFILVIVILNLGYKIGGIILSSLLSLISVVLILYSINGHLVGIVSTLKFRNFLKLILITVPVGFFIYGDDIFIRRLFDEKTAGLYASVSILGKAFVWFCITIFSVFFVKIISEVRNYKKILGKYLIFLILISLFVELGILSIGKYLFVILFGKEFLEAFELLKIYIPLYMPLLVNILLITANVGVEAFTYMIYLHLFLYYTGFLVIPFNSYYDYLYYIFSINFFFMIIYLIRIFRFS